MAKKIKISKVVLIFGIIGLLIVGGFIGASYFSKKEYIGENGENPYSRGASLQQWKEGYSYLPSQGCEYITNEDCLVDTVSYKNGYLEYYCYCK